MLNKESKQIWVIAPSLENSLSFFKPKEKHQDGEFI